MKRIVAIDTLRGFALLGILAMNIMSFAMPQIAYFNPAAFGGDEWFNRLTYAVVHIMTDSKFMGLFSLLFGASVVLFTQNLERKGGKVARIHYSRNIWLLIIGLAHGIFIWEGDVLVLYAICSFVLFFFRKMRPSWQFAIGLTVFLLPAVGYIVGDQIISGLPAGEMAALQAEWRPSAGVLAAEIDYYRGDYWSQVAARAAETESSSITSAVDVFYAILSAEFFARGFGMMMIGMAFYQWGVITAKRSDRFYRRMLLGLPIGIAISGLGVVLNSAAGWDAQQAMFLGKIPNLIATPLVVSGYIGMIMLWSRTEFWRGLQDRLSATGRTALTNYIGQSVIATFIFYGFGLGLFGSLNRITLILVMVLIWALQLWISPIWLRYFRYGPLEWIWRTLSYWKIQPLRKKPVPAVG